MSLHTGLKRQSFFKKNRKFLLSKSLFAGKEEKIRVKTRNFLKSIQLSRLSELVQISNKSNIKSDYIHMSNVLEPRFPKNYRFYYLNTHYRLINKKLGSKKARALGTNPHPRKRSRGTGERPAAGSQRRLHGPWALTTSKAAHARPGPQATHRARATRAPGRSPRRPAQHGGVRQQKRKRPRWKASARPGSGAYTCSRKASGRPHSAQASPAGPGSPAAPSHAGRPPTLLGN